DDFKKSDGSSVETDFMQVEHTFNVASSNDYQAIQLPYTDRKFDMIVVKPQVGKSLDDLKTTFQNPTAIKGLVDGFHGANAIVHLPKFKTSYQNSLNDMLASFGMIMPFTNGADFSGITADEQIKISGVVHKAVVDVGEEGTEAA